MGRLRQLQGPAAKAGVPTRSRDAIESVHPLCQVMKVLAVPFPFQPFIDRIAAVIAQKTFAFAIDHTDNAQLIDVFTFASYGGVHLGPAS